MVQFPLGSFVSTEACTLWKEPVPEAFQIRKMMRHFVLLRLHFLPHPRLSELFDSLETQDPCGDDEGCLQAHY